MLQDILKSEKINELQSALQKNESILIEHLWNTPKALITTLAHKATEKHLLVLTGGNQEETRLFQDISFFTDVPLLNFPAWETLPSENIAPSPDIVGERYRALREIATHKTPLIVLSNLQACLQKIILPKDFEHIYLEFIKGQTYPFKSIAEKLQALGYQRSLIVSDKGQFAVRGGIIDIFPVSSPDPYRLEFWEDELESLRIFDPIGQKSVRQTERIEITPAQEMELIAKKPSLGTILDYLGPNTVIIYDDLLAIEDRYSALVSGISSKSFCHIEEFLDKVSLLQHVFFSQQSIEELSDVQAKNKRGKNYYSVSSPMKEISFQIFNRDFIAKRWIDPFATIGEFLLPDCEDQNNTSGAEILKGLEKLSGSDTKLYTVFNTESDLSHFQKQLSDSAIPLPKHTEYTKGYLSNGIVFTDLNLIILPLTEITKRYKILRQKQRSTYHTPPVETFDLSAGEMIVHYHNGIGQYQGIEKRPNHNGVLSEFFKIEYADNAKLYVPINQAYLITKYIGSNEEEPTRHTLGSSRWKKTRDHAEKTIIGYASELLELYAKREIKGGFRFNQDSSEMKTFEEDFPYTETEDQLLAIASIKTDMTSEKPMDRLICGDVGYGKTEVAMRAAFKAVADGQKQVALLVPTTVLAMQHYENFIDRFTNFPITIGVLSRFRTAKQIKETLEGIKNGAIDIVIGTHRIISEDVLFKDLGLVIIDEEQRFGVKAKEHLKKMKVSVDCLTLSATPIPRTLYMSLIGARDMSIINTPPQDRLPITTIITEANEQVIKNALLRELARDGQAYIIHNRVDTIYEYAERIQNLLPKARIVVGHGQMNPDEIDHVFHTFKSGQADILIATTIVENGIDIPNANTIIIDRSDRFGIADLYQLRGRVGRWNRRAYAYFFVPSKRVLPEIVTKRLSALANSSGYGGGMKVAMHDLRIRGAGNILGLEQSGQVSSIGFHLYCKLLKRTILSLQGKIPNTLVETKIEFSADARIPDTYIEEANLRMEVYQRLGEAISSEEIDQIQEELSDRFGPPPEPALWLYHLSRIRVFASRLGITLLKQEKLTLIIEKQKGKELSLRKILMQWPKTPKEMEKKVISVLKAD